MPTIQKQSQILPIALCTLITVLLVFAATQIYQTTMGQKQLASTQQGTTSYSELLKKSEGRDSIAPAQETLHGSAETEDGSGLIMPDLPAVRADRE